MTSAWFKRFGRRGTADVRLFCFHHAGGSASSFRGWPRLLPEFVEPVAVQLPGRADRLRESPFTSMPELVDAVVDVMEPLLDRPFACYGLSLGAKLSWVLGHRLRERGMPMPAALFLASVAAPGTGEGRGGWQVDDERLIAYLREMGGSPAELFAQPELLAAVLPTLRADLVLVDSYLPPVSTPLDLPIRAFAGAADIEGPPERMRGWSAATTGRFDLDVVSGGHFFDSGGEAQVIQAISGDLRREVSGLLAVDP